MIRILVDMDEVLADFTEAAVSEDTNPPEMYRPGFFLNMKPVPGSLEAMQILYQIEGAEIEVVTKPAALSPICYTEKAQWLAKWIPYLQGAVTMTQNKNNIKGDILIDDDDWSAFEGTLIRFKVGGGELEWARVIEEVKRIIYNEKT